MLEMRSTAGVNRKQSEWAKTLRYVCARLIDNGLGGILILGGTIIICNSPGWFPWIIVSILGSYWSKKARERIDRWKRDAMGMTYGTA